MKRTKIGAAIVSSLLLALACSSDGGQAPGTGMPGVGGAGTGAAAAPAAAAGAGVAAAASSGAPGTATAGSGTTAAGTGAGAPAVAAGAGMAGAAVANAGAAMGGTAGAANVGGAGMPGAGTPAAGGAAGMATGGTAGAGMAGAGMAGDATGGTAGMAAGGAPAAGMGGANGGTGGTVADDSLFTVDYQLASDVDSSAPGTVGIVTFQTTVSGMVDARIEFGLDDNYGMTAPVDLNETDYRTLLLGMKPSSTYHFRIVAGDGTMSYSSGDYQIDTGPAGTVNMPTYNVANAGALERGFLLLSYWNGQNSGVGFILDADGDLVWWYNAGSNGIARMRMSASGKNMWLIEPSNNGGPVRRVSMDGLDAQTYSAIGSHDLTAVSGETMAFLEYGESDCNSVFEIDPSGNTTEIFESQGVVGGGGGFGCHANALRYSAAEDFYTFSEVSEDVFILNRSGGVEWRLTDIVGSNSTWGGIQHGHQLLDDSIIILANSGGSGNASAAIEYDRTTGQEIFRYESGNATQNLGDVQRLPGGNTLVNFGNDGVIHEVDPQGNVVLEMSGNGSFGYSMWRETLYGPPPDISM